MDFFYFWWPSFDYRSAVMEAHAVSYSKFTIPPADYETVRKFGHTDIPPSTCRDRPVRPISPSHTDLLIPSTMARQKITRDELMARAKANGYQRGAHR